MFHRSAAVVLALLVLAFGVVESVGAQEPPCVLCAGGKTVACPTCDGAKRGVQPCNACAGLGKQFCPGRVATLDGADFAATRLLHTGTERSCTSDWCIDGKVKFDAKSYPCRPCGGAGKLPCADCREAQSPCPACAGKKGRDGPCEDCAATGRIPCMVCVADGPPCEHADADAPPPCARCAAEGIAMQTCMGCRGRGTRPCLRCRAAARIVCRSCCGSGKHRTVYEDGTTAESNKCDPCDGKGTLPCVHCKQGVAKCGSCDGAKRVRTPCLACGASKRPSCRACGRWAIRMLEIEAVLLGRRQGPDASAARAAAADLYGRAIAKARKVADDAEAAAETGRPICGQIWSSPKGISEKDAEHIAQTNEATLARYATEFGGWQELRVESCLAAATLARLQSDLAKLRRPVAPPPSPSPK